MLSLKGCTYTAGRYVLDNRFQLDSTQILSIRYQSVPLYLSFMHDSSCNDLFFFFFLPLSLSRAISTLRQISLTKIRCLIKESPQIQGFSRFVGNFFTYRWYVVYEIRFLDFKMPLSFFLQIFSTLEAEDKKKVRYTNQITPFLLIQ